MSGKGKLFKYETHLHTAEASACAVSRGAEYVPVYKKLGYDGIFVTDHFFGGNTTVPRALDWEERIRLYARGYESARAEAERLNGDDGGNFKVFFGIEQTFQGDDYLIYGLSKEFLIAHPEIEGMTHAELFRTVDGAGGLMIQAHPFRLRHYNEAIHLHPREVHGAEVYNAGNRESENALAEFYAAEYGFIETSGSDIHSADFAAEEKTAGKMRVGGVAFGTPVLSVEDFIARVKKREHALIK